MKKIKLHVPAFSQLADRLKETAVSVTQVFSHPGAERKAERQDPSERFRQLWTQALTERADVFNGLFTSLERVADQKTKKGDQVLGEWAQRTRYHWQGTPLDALTQQVLGATIEQGDKESWARWAALLLEAAREAGIDRDQVKTVVLGAHEVSAYIYLGQGEIHPGDLVRIITPAWYQAGRVIEQGYVRRCRETELQEKDHFN